MKKTFEEKLVNEAADIFNNYDGVCKRNDDNSITIANFGSEDFKDLMNNADDARDVMKFAYTDGYIEGSKNHYGDGARVTAAVTTVVGTCLGVIIGYCFSDFISSGIDKIYDATDKRQETKEVKKKIEAKFDIKIKRIKIVADKAYVKFKDKFGDVKELIFDLKENEPIHN